MKNNVQYLQHSRKEVSLTNTIRHIQPAKKLNSFKFYSNQTTNYLISILINIFISGYQGKTADFAKNSFNNRTTIAHFLNPGKWDDSLLSDTLKRSVIEIIYTNHIEQHTARWFSAWLPPMQYTISGHQCTILIYLFISTTKNKRAVDQAFSQINRSLSNFRIQN